MIKYTNNTRVRFLRDGAWVEFRKPPERKPRMLSDYVSIKAFVKVANTLEVQLPKRDHFLVRIPGHRAIQVYGTPQHSLGHVRLAAYVAMKTGRKRVTLMERRPLLPFDDIGVQLSDLGSLRAPQGWYNRVLDEVACHGPCPVEDEKRWPARLSHQDFQQPNWRPGLKGQEENRLSREVKSVVITVTNELSADEKHMERQHAQYISSVPGQG